MSFKLKQGRYPEQTLYTTYPASHKIHNQLSERPTSYIQDQNYMQGIIYWTFSHLYQGGEDAEKRKDENKVN